MEVHLREATATSSDSLRLHPFKKWGLLLKKRKEFALGRANSSSSLWYGKTTARNYVISLECLCFSKCRYILMLRHILMWFPLNAHNFHFTCAYYCTFPLCMVTPSSTFMLWFRSAKALVRLHNTSLIWAFAVYLCDINQSLMCWLFYCDKVYFLVNACYALDHKKMCWGMFESCYKSTGQSGAFGNMSGNRCKSDSRSRGREFNPGPIPILSWRWIMK